MPVPFLQVKTHRYVHFNLQPCKLHSWLTLCAMSLTLVANPSNSANFQRTRTGAYHFPAHKRCSRELKNVFDSQIRVICATCFVFDICVISLACKRPLQHRSYQNCALNPSLKRTISWELWKFVSSQIRRCIAQRVLDMERTRSASKFDHRH